MTNIATMMAIATTAATDVASRAELVRAGGQLRPLGRGQTRPELRRVRAGHAQGREARLHEAALELDPGKLEAAGRAGSPRGRERRCLDEARGARPARRPRRRRATRASEGGAVGLGPSAGAGSGGAAGPEGRHQRLTTPGPVACDQDARAVPTGSRSRARPARRRRAAPAARPADPVRGAPPPARRARPRRRITAMPKDPGAAGSRPRPSQSSTSSGIACHRAAPSGLKFFVFTKFMP